VGLYTRSGDRGTTTLFVAREGRIEPLRLPKNHPLIELIGSLDEANSFVGLARSLAGPEYRDLDKVLSWVQRLLFDAGFVITSGKRISSDVIAEVERLIDSYYGEPLRRFILPSGPPFVASLHVARSILRRAERRLVDVVQRNDVGVNIDPNLQALINRLSDLLFAIALEALKRSGYQKEEV